MQTRSLIYTALALAFLVATMPAGADLAAGTPLFTWTLPTKNVDGSTIPATGTNALKEVRLYCDGATTPTKATAVPGLSWQTAAGDFLAGSHSCVATAVTNGGAESAKTNPLAFTVPTIPGAPSGLSVQ
jgi:hypothetical protein